MGFKNNGYATVWSVEPKGNFTKVRIACSRKNKLTQQYEQDFSGFCMFIGQANEKAGKLKEKDRIKLLECDVTTKYDSSVKREYVDYKVFDFEMAEGTPMSKPTAAAQKTPEFLEENSTESDDLPF